MFITDSNRRRVFVTSRVRQNVGYTQTAEQAFTPDAAVLNPFAQLGSGAQTVAVFTGVRYVEAPYNPELAQFPEHSPYAAFDGDPGTSWQADPTLDPSRAWIQVGFDAPRNVPYINLLPDQSDPLVRLTRVQIGGRTYALHPGWNRLAVNLRQAGTLRILLTKVRSLGSNTGSAGGLAEVRIPGVHVGELLRPPTVVERALRGADLSHAPLTYVLERTTADQPLQRGPAPAETIVHGSRLQAEAALIGNAQDAETGIDRVLDPPAVRAWTISGLRTVSPTAPDPQLDRIAGTRTNGAAFSSSARLQGTPRYRASAAFDGSAHRLGCTDRALPAGLDRVEHAAAAGACAASPWSAARSRSVSRPESQVVALGRPRATAVTVAVGPGRAVRLPRPLRARGFRLQIVSASGSARPAVGLPRSAAPGSPARWPQPPGRSSDAAARRRRSSTAGAWR